MSSTFSVALSSLQAQSEAITATGNNLANANTVAFKGSSIDFQDALSQSLGGMELGMGVGTPITVQDFSQGALQSSTSPYAAAIEGSGFFVVQNAAGQQMFTRDGDFTLSPTGYLQTQTGENVQGWMATANGVNSTGAPGNIVLATGQVLPPVATQNLSISANLDGNAATGSTPVSFPISVYDSLGNSHNLTITFTPSGTANQWTYQVSIPTADLTAAAAAAGGTSTTGTTTSGSATISVSSATGIAVGDAVTGTGIPANTTVTAISGTTLTLSQNATASGTGVSLTFVGPQTNLLATPGSLTFNSDGTMSSASNPSPVALNISGLLDGASNISLNWSLFDSSGNGLLTQYVQPSALGSSTQDGSAAAQLTKFSIQNGGQVVATYSNGQTKVEAQLALASIENPNSLQNAGNNNYIASGSTSTPAFGLPGTGGRGQIVSGQLESSNVDLATQFTNLIEYQSGYQAASKVITTADQMTQELLDLIH